MPLPRCRGEVERQLSSATTKFWIATQFLVFMGVLLKRLVAISLPRKTWGQVRQTWKSCDARRVTSLVYSAAQAILLLSPRAVSFVRCRPPRSIFGKAKNSGELLLR